MMAAIISTHSNFYVQIKNKSLKLKDRLQLLRHCWKSTDLYYPNKEQVLLDVLTGILINKKNENLSASDVALVWKCLHEILQTKKAAEPGRILLKQSTVQLLTDSVSNVDSACTFVQSLIGCLFGVMRSDSLSSMFSAKLDTMVTVLNGLCVIQSLETFAEDQVFSSLVNITVDRFLIALETAPDQNQILLKICGSFIPKFIPLWCLDPSTNVKKLSSALLGSLCHRDHVQNFDVYLKANQSSSGTHVHRKAKPVEQLFSTLSSLLKLNPVHCSLYLPVIYDSFIQHNCHNGIHLVAHYMMAEICSLVGVLKDNNYTNKTVEDAHVFVTINRLLEVNKIRELYDIGIDEKNGHIQLQFYRHIIQVLVNCRQMSGEDTRSYADWYDCFTTLLQINHHILEPKLLEIMNVGWIDTQVLDKDIDALDKLLHELVVIYSKLRQIPKLITKILGSLCVCQGDRVLQTPPMFLKRYGEIIQSLPQGMMLDIWKKFAATLKTHFVEAEETGNFQGVCVLFRHYLLNVKVADYSVTEMTLQSVWDLITIMETDILGPSLTKCLEETQVDYQKLTYTLYLCEAWGEVVMMLSFYSKSKTSLKEKPLALQLSDLSFIHSYLHTKQWQLLYKLVQKKKNACLLFIWDVLIVQRLRSVLIFKNMPDWLSEANAISGILEYLSDVNVNQATPWSGNFDAINDTNLAVGRWYLLTRNMSAVCSILSEEQLRTIANFTISSLSMKKSGSGLTLCSLSKEFLASDVVRENANLLSCMITAIWSKCSSCFTTGQPGSIKKKKSSELLTSVISLMSMLSDSHYIWSQTDKSELSEKGREVSEVLSKVLHSKDSIRVAERENMHCCVKLLQSLPLDKVRPCDQIKCIVGLQAVKCISDKSVQDSQDTLYTDVSTTCVELCTVMIESCNVERLFEIISVDLYLSWLHSVLNCYSVQSVEYYKCVLLAETSCQVIVRDFGVLEELQKFAVKLVPGESVSLDVGALNLMSFLLQEIGKFLNRSYLQKTLKAGYTDLFLSLVQRTMKVNSLWKSQDALHVKCILVRIYTTVITLLSIDEDTKREFLGNFRDIMNWCANVVEKMVKSDVYAVMSALIFFQTLYKHHKLLPDLVDHDTKWKTWKLLVVVLKQLLADESVPSLHTQSSPHTVDPSTICGHSEHRDKKEEKVIQTGSVTGGWSSQMTNHSEKIKNILEGSDESCCYDTNINKMPVDTIHSLSNNASTNWEDNVNHGNIHSMFRAQIFKGGLEEQGSNLIRMQVQSVMATLLVSFDLELFKTVTQSLINDVHPDSLLNDKLQLQSSLLIWRYLLTLTLTDDVSKAIRHSAKDMMLNMHGLSHVLQYQVCDNLARDIGVPVLSIQTQMLRLGKNLLTSRSSVLSLHCCLYTPLKGSCYFPAFHAVYEILDTLLVHHSDTVFLNIPAFTQCCKRLLLSVVEQSNQDHIAEKQEIIKQLITCAYQMERLFSLIATHKVEFGKVAVYIISDYLCAVQKLTMLPAVKRALIPAVYKMLDLCDRHTISQLHVVLNQGVTEVFKLLYNEYKKFHKYQGKI